VYCHVTKKGQGRYSFIFTGKSSTTYFHETWEVWTLGGPVYIAILLVDLDLFFKVVIHFREEIWKINIAMTLLFLDKFWPNFTEMGYYTTPSLWPSFGDLDLLLQVRPDIGVLIYYVKQVRVPFLQSWYRWPCVTSQGHTVRWRWWSLVIVYDDYTSSIILILLDPRAGRSSEVTRRFRVTWIG